MANKITGTLTLSITAGSGNRASMTANISEDQDGSNYTEETQTIPVAPASSQLDIGEEIVKLGHFLLRNLATPPVDKNVTPNDVSISTDEAGSNVIAVCSPGRGIYLAPPGATNVLYAAARVAPCPISFLAIEE